MIGTPDDAFTTADEQFTSRGTACAARIYRSTHAPAQGSPVVVMAHGFGSVRALRLYAYAERFATAGYAVVVFDYRGFGDSEGSPRQVLDVGMQHDDWRAALDFARGLPGVDPEKVIAWGTSFAGGHVIALAGRGEPVAAIIAQVPHISGPASVRATGAAAGARVIRVGLRDQAAAWLGRAPVYIDCVGRVGETAVMTSPDAVPGLERLAAESGLVEGDYPQVVAARIGLKIGLYSPGRVASGVKCPALVQIVEQDAVTPRKVAQRAAEKMKKATIRIYEGGHFDPYVEPLFSKIVADQLDFLREHVPSTPTD